MVALPPTGKLRCKALGTGCRNDCVLFDDVERLFESKMALAPAASSACRNHPAVCQLALTVRTTFNLGRLTLQAKFMAARVCSAHRFNLPTRNAFIDWIHPPNAD